MFGLEICSPWRKLIVLDTIPAELARNSNRELHEHQSDRLEIYQPVRTDWATLWNKGMQHGTQTVAGTESFVLSLCKHQAILDRFMWDWFGALGRSLFTCYLQSHRRQMIWRIDSMCLFNKFLAELPTQCWGYYPFNNPASGVPRPCPLMITVRRW